MNWFQKLMSLRDALNYGEKLSNPATWKKAQNAVNAVAGLLTTVAPFVPQLTDVPMETLAPLFTYIGGGAYAVVTLFNLFVTTASTDKIGLPVKALSK